MRDKALICSMAAVALMALVACGGGSTSDQAGHKTSDVAQRDISDTELALMTVPLKDIGAEYAGFELADSSGLQSNESAIASADDKENKTKDIEEFGRTKGYEASYVDWQAMSAGQGAFMAGTWVDILKDADAADGYMADMVQDMEGEVGVTTGGGTVLAVHEFDTGNIGEGSKGLLAEIQLSSDVDASQPVWHCTFIFIRRGWLVGAASLVRTDDKDVRDEALSLAQKLDDRIQGVLEGRITAGAAAGD
jgi:hypothetical protein